MKTWQELRIPVLRGEIPWTALRDAGAEIHRTSRVWEFGPDIREPIIVAAADLLAGIRRNVSDPKQAQIWAEFFLAASDVFDTDDLTSTDFGEECLEVMWDLARGDTTTARALVAHLDS